MIVKYLALLIVILSLAGCAEISLEQTQQQGKVYVIGDSLQDSENSGPSSDNVEVYILSDISNNAPKVFEIEGDIDTLLDSEARKRANELNQLRALRDDNDNLEQFELESKYRNVKTAVDGEFNRGYSKEYEDPDFISVE